MVFGGVSVLINHDKTNLCKFGALADLWINGDFVGAQIVNEGCGKGIIPNNTLADIQWIFVNKSCKLKNFSISITISVL